MPNFATTLMWNGSNGRWSLKEHTYTAFYRTVVTTDADEEEPLLQASSLIQNFVTNVVPLGAFYQYANDPLDVLSVLLNVDAERDLGSRNVWILRAEYGPRDEQGQDSDDNPTNDPLEYRPELHWQTTQYTKAVEKARYWGGILPPQEAKTGGLGAQLAPCNSAFSVLVPGLEMDDARGMLVLKRHYATINGDVLMGMMNLINQDTFKFDYRGFVKTIQPLTLKVQEMTVTEKEINSKWYWEVIGKLAWRADDWREDTVDMGIEPAVYPTAPDGRGGTYSSGDFEVTTPGMVRKRKGVEGDENLLTEEVLFDGKGQPQDPETALLAPIYITWGKYTEVLMKQWEFLAPFLESE